MERKNGNKIFFLKMRHTSRLLLIPEEIYRGLLSVGADGSAKGLVESRMAAAVNDPKLNADAKALKYQQEYKRYSKLRREEEERPVDVKLQNLQEIANVMQQNQPIPPPPPPPLATTIKVQVPQSRGAKKKGGIPLRRIRKKQQPGDKDVFHDATEVSTSSSSADNRHDQAMRYIRANARDMGVDMGSGQIVSTGSTSGDTAATLRTSNINEIVAHLLRNEGVRRLPLPVGYDQFRRRLDRHTNFKKIYEKQKGTGMVTFHKKTIIKPSTPFSSSSSSTFRFKPMLWS
jgi:hypothetical protein